jgi:hypothetical protein
MFRVCHRPDRIDRLDSVVQMAAPHGADEPSDAGINSRNDPFVESRQSG